MWTVCCWERVWNRTICFNELELVEFIPRTAHENVAWRWMRKTLQNPNNYTPKYPQARHLTALCGAWQRRSWCCRTWSTTINIIQSKTFPLFMAKCDLLELVWDTVMTVISFTFGFFLFLYQTQFPHSPQIESHFSALESSASQTSYSILHVTLFEELI